MLTKDNVQNRKKILCKMIKTKDQNEESKKTV